MSPVAMRLSVVVFFTSAVAGCRADADRSAESSHPPADKAEVPAEEAADEPPAGPSALARAEKAATEHMGTHFEQGRQLQRKLVVADLDGARKAATTLAAASPSSYPADWMPYVIRLRDAANAASQAADLAAAAAGAGTIAAACGDCHAALGSGPTLAVSTPPSEDPTGMKHHEWAAARMWGEEIVTPSDDAWRDGTANFATLPECRPDFGGEQGHDKALQGVRERVDSLTARAASVSDTAARAVVYGEYLGACADCHAAGC